MHLLPHAGLTGLYIERYQHHSGGPPDANHGYDLMVSPCVNGNLDPDGWVYPEDWELPTYPTAAEADEAIERFAAGDYEAHISEVAVHRFGDDGEEPCYFVLSKTPKGAAALRRIYLRVVRQMFEFEEETSGGEASTHPARMLSTTAARSMATGYCRTLGAEHKALTFYIDPFHGFVEIYTGKLETSKSGRIGCEGKFGVDWFPGTILGNVDQLARYEDADLSGRLLAEFTRSPDPTLTHIAEDW